MKRYTPKRVAGIIVASAAAIVLAIVSVPVFMICSLLGWTSAVELMRETLMRFATWFDKEVLG